VELSVYVYKHVSLYSIPSGTRPYMTSVVYYLQETAVGLVKKHKSKGNGSSIALCLVLLSPFQT